MRTLAWLLVLGLALAAPASAQDDATDPVVEAPPEEPAEPGVDGEAAESPEPEPEPVVEATVEAAPEPEAADPGAPEPEPTDPEGIDALDEPAAPALLAPALEDAEEEDDELAAREVVASSPRHLLGRSLAVWLELGLSGGGRGDQRADFAFAPEFGVRFRPDRGLYVGASFGFTAAATQVSGEVTAAGETTRYEGASTRLDPGNPTMELGYSGAVSRDLRLEIGIGAAIPTAARAQPGSDEAGLIERAASEVSHRAAMAMRGYWSPWRWAPERFGLYAPVRVAGLFGDLLVEGELGVGVMVPVLGDRGIDADVIVQLAAGVGGRVAEPLHLGVRLRGVGSALGVTLTGADAMGAPASEAVVFSAEPWVRLRVDPVQVTLRADVSFNGADGVGGDRAPPFGVFLGVGGEVE